MDFQRLTVVSDNFFPVEEMLFEAAKAFWKLDIKYWQIFCKEFACIKVQKHENLCIWFLPYKPNCAHNPDDFYIHSSLTIQYIKSYSNNTEATQGLCSARNY